MSRLIAVALMALGPGSSSAAAADDTVHVAIAGATGFSQTRALETTLRGFAREAGLVIEVQSRDFALPEVLRPDGLGFAPRARFWIDLRPATRAVLYTLDNRGGRANVRAFARRPDEDGLVSEQLGLTFRTLLDAVLGGEEIGARAEEVRETLGLTAPSAKAAAPAVVADASPPHVARPPPRARIALQVFYGIHALARAAPVLDGPGAALSLRLGAGARSFPLAHVGAQWLLQDEVSARGDLAIDLWMVRTRAGLGWCWQTPGATGFSLAATFGLDGLSARARPDAASGLRATGWARAWGAAAGAFATAWWPLVPKVGIFVRASADVELRDFALAVREPASPSVVLDAWPVRPTVDVGLVF